MRRVLAGLLVGASILLAGLARAAESPAAAEPLVSVEDQRADFAALYAGLRANHYDLYARLDRKAYDRLYRRTLAGLEQPAPRLEVERRFQTFIAAGRVAHARIDYILPAFRAWRKQGGTQFPIPVRVMGGHVLISQAPRTIPELGQGAEITAISGVPMRNLMRRIRANVSADDDYMSDSLIELDFAPWLWLELGPQKSFEVRLKGQAKPVTVQSMTRDQIAAEFPAKALDIDVTERVAKVYPGGVAYLRPGVFINLDPGADPYDTASFRRFIDGAFETYQRAGATRLIIDLRDNPGGHNAFSDPMIAWFATRPFHFFSQFRIKASVAAVQANAERLSAGEPGREASLLLQQAYAKARSPGDLVDLPSAEAQPRAGGRFTGAVYVLVNRRTYSNSVAVAALVQDYGFGKIMGEPTSDLATTFGAMEQFSLPRTGILVGYPKAYIVRPNASVAAKGVTPDLPITTPVFEGQDDPVLAEAMRRVSKP